MAKVKVCIDTKTMDHIMYKANMIRNGYKAFCSKNKIDSNNFIIVDMYDAFLSIIEDLGIWDDVIEERTHYVLPLDSYGQPNGTVIEKTMTRYEAKETPYCFEDVEAAYARALD